MSADGVAERRATIAKIETVPGLSGLVFRGAVPEGAEVPRDSSGRVLAHVVVDFTAPIQSVRDRALANGELGQPHLLGASIAIISGNIDWSEDVMKDVMHTLIDWAPSSSSDPWEAKGGYGSRRPATGNVPTRYIEGLFLECAVNTGPNGTEPEPDEDEEDEGPEPDPEP